MKRLTIEEMKIFAISKEGLCLSTKYKNNLIKLKWQCKYNHIFDANFNHVKQGNTWCPYCAGNLPLGIKELQDIAKKKEGECLSTKYENNHSKLVFKCKEGHVWNTVAMGIKEGTWCPYCAGLGDMLPPINGVGFLIH